MLPMVIVCHSFCCIVFHHVNVPQFIHFATDKHVGNSQGWDITNSAARNIIVDVFSEQINTFPLGALLGKTHAYIHMFSFCRYGQTIF